jgi:hypothetical protein
MAFNDQANQRRFYFFVIDAGIGHDDVGWQIYFRTPLFGIVKSRNWFSFRFGFPEGRSDAFYFGLIAKWPCAESEPMYRWKWERETIANPQASKGPTRLEMVRRTLRGKWWPGRKPKPNTGVAPGDGDSQEKPSS